jgi:predicted protein tyrosine phosphatase
VWRRAWLSSQGAEDVNGEGNRGRHILFICSRNQLRSPTAEQIFSKWSGIEVASAGLDPVSHEPVTPELLAWAEVIFVMEKSHRNRLLKKFRASVKDQKIIVLGITDDYEYMDPRLVRLFEKLVPPPLGMATNQARG